MSDFTDSLRNEDDSEIKSFVLELFDRVDDLHDNAKTELEQAYHQGEKDALRRVLTMMTGRDVDLIIPTSVIAYKMRGEIKTIEAELLEVLEQVRDRAQDDSPAMWKRVDDVIAKAKGEA